MLQMISLPCDFVEGAQNEDEVNGDAANWGRHLEGDCREAGEYLIERAEERRRADVEVWLYYGTH